MKHKLSTFFAILMMVLANHQNGFASNHYHFSAVSPTGQTLYYRYIGDGINVEVTAPQINDNWNDFVKPIGNLTIPSTVTINGNTLTVSRIRSDAFQECTGLTSVIIPITITELGARCFKNCTGLSSVTFNARNCTTANGGNSVAYSDRAFYGCNNITSFTFGNSVKRIPMYLCADLEGLTSITIPDSVTKIYVDAFRGDTNLTSVLFNAQYCDTYLPLYITSKWVFRGCYNITNFSFGDSVHRIPDYLCYGLSGLTAITIPESVTTIGYNAFRECTSLNTVFFNARNCFSAGGRLMDENVFYECGNITEFIFGNNVQWIPNYLCCCVTELTSVTIPNSVSSIGSYAFENCSGLTSVTIPNSVSGIGEYAFHGCIGLTSVTIGTSVTSIGEFAFYCRGLTSITSLASIPPSLAENTFTSVNHQIPVYVPCESVSAYQSASGWSSFSNIQCNSAQTYTITVTSANPTMGTVTGGGTYNSGATATLTAMPNSGYHFVRWQDNNTQNPRTITVTANATYTAYFEADGGDDDCPTITQFPWNATFDESLSCWKTVDADGDGYNWVNYQDYVVSESYSYFDGSNQGLTPDNWLISRRIQIPSSGSYTLSWTARGLNDNYFNEHYSVYVSTTGDNPSNFSTQLFSETLNTPNAVNRSKSLESYRGQTIRIAFRHHNTNDVFVLGIGNVKISQGTQGIEDIEENDVHIYVEGQIVHISEIDGQDVTVYSIDGRTVASVTNAAGQCSIPVPATGVYMVKIGNHPARKVVVMR